MRGWDRSAGQEVEEKSKPPPSKTEDGAPKTDQRLHTRATRPTASGERTEQERRGARCIVPLRGTVLAWERGGGAAWGENRQECLFYKTATACREAKRGTMYRVPTGDGNGMGGEQTGVSVLQGPRGGDVPHLRRLFFSFLDSQPWRAGLNCGAPTALGDRDRGRRCRRARGCLA
jgi:hypothetical protein